MPSDLCSPEVHSPLSDIFLNNNQLTGTLDVSACQNLILLNAAFNNLTGALYSPQGYNHMHTVQLQSNEFNMTDTLDGIIAGGRVTEVNMADNRHNEFDYSARTGRLQLVAVVIKHACLLSTLEISPPQRPLAPFSSAMTYFDMIYIFCRDPERDFRAALLELSQHVQQQSGGKLVARQRQHNWV